MEKYGFLTIKPRVKIYRPFILRLSWAHDNGKIVFDKKSKYSSDWIKMHIDFQLLIWYNRLRKIGECKNNFKNEK